MPESAEHNPLRFLADENFNGKLLTGLLNALSELDVIRVQDTDKAGSPDPKLLAWAAEQNRILLTHDVQTLAGFAYDRVRAGVPMPGIIEVRISASMGIIIDELVLLITASTAEEFENQVRYIPLR
jgi:predicted nuclease of predicted toxin-antitoxin system